MGYEDMRNARKEEQPPEEVEAVPPFWVRPHDYHGVQIDVRVTDVARRLWPWAYRFILRELHDGGSAAELMEDVAIRVSNRLQVEAEVARNLNGYFIAALHNSVRSHVRRERRLIYEGLLRELEENHKQVAPSLAAALEQRIILSRVVSYLTYQVRHMLHCRLLGFSWKEIGRVVDASPKQAKARFYYGIQVAFDRLLADQDTRRNREEPTNGEE